MPPSTVAPHHVRALVIQRGMVEKAMHPHRPVLHQSAHGSSVFFRHHRNVDHPCKRLKSRANSGRSAMPYTKRQARDLHDLFHPYTNLKLLEETGPLIIERARACASTTPPAAIISKRCRACGAPRWLGRQ